MCERLLGLPNTEKVTVFDNFSSGREWHIEKLMPDSRFKLVRGDLHDMGLLVDALTGHDCVMHFASNPDISKAFDDPDIDFRQGTELTRNIVEASRISNVSMVLYTSGSGVYGDLGEKPLVETMGPLIPVSTYAASKIAGEALVCAYAYMFGFKSLVFRFANVVGPNQTHGVGYDFIKRLYADNTCLRILGDGHQSKSYIHVDDVVSAMLTALDHSSETYAIYNVGTGDAVTVNEITDLAIEVVGLKGKQVRIDRTGGAIGWVGDVPVMRMNSEKIISLGWKSSRTSIQALRDAMSEMLTYVKSGNI